MGYDYHITRADHWTNSLLHPITLLEWHQYIEYDKELQLQNLAQIKLPVGKPLVYSNEGLAAWTVYSRIEDGIMAWFDYSDGEIIVNNPDREILIKAFEIAWSLKANLLGEYGEKYTEEDYHRDKNKRAQEKRSWLQRIFG
jgi:hypothetical protein